MFARIAALILTNVLVLFAQDALRGWSANTDTALVLVNVEQSETQTTFVLENTSDQAITAVVLSYDNTRRGTDYFPSDTVLSPREKYLLAVDNQELVGSKRVLRISVLFADDRGQGSQREVDFIKANRLGRMLEIERVKGILEAAQGPVKTSIEVLRAQIGSLPNTPAEALTSIEAVPLPGADIDRIKSSDARVRDWFLDGVRQERQEALWKIDRLRGLPVTATTSTERTQADSLAELQQLYRTLSTKSRGQLNLGAMRTQ